MTFQGIPSSKQLEQVLEDSLESLLQPAVSKLLVSHSDIDAVVVTGKSIMSYFESRNVTVINVSRPTEGKYIVSVTANPEDVEKFCSRNHKIKKYPIKVKPYQEEMAYPDTIEVLYPCEALSEEDLDNYFSGPVSGRTDDGEDKMIEWIKTVEPGKCHIKFKSHKDAAYVLAKQNHHFMKKPLTVSAIVHGSHPTKQELPADVKPSEETPTTKIPSIFHPLPDLPPHTNFSTLQFTSSDVTACPFTTKPPVHDIKLSSTILPPVLPPSINEDFIESMLPANDSFSRSTHTTCTNPDVVSVNGCSRMVNPSHFKYKRNKLIIQNIPENITKEFVEYHLKNTLKMDCKGNYSFELQEGNCALLTFTKEYTLEELKSFCENITSQKMKGQFPLAELQRITVADGIEEGDGSMQGHDKKYERNKLIIRNIPEGVDDDESFGVIIGGMLELDEDDSSFSIELKKASALLTFDKEYSIEELKALCKKIASEKLKGQVLVAELCKTNCTVLITEIARKLFASQDELKKYFKNKRTGGGRDVVEDIVMLDKKKAKVTFKTSQTVASVLSKDHSVLGPNVKIIACSPLIDIEEDKSSEELCDDTPSSLPTEKRKKSSLSSADKVVIESKKMRRDCPSKRINLDLLVAKYLSNNSKLLDGIGKEVSATITVIDRDNGVIEVLMNDAGASPDDLELAVTQFQSSVSNKVGRADIHYPPEASAEASKSIIQFCSDKNFPMNVVNISKCIGLAGQVDQINDLKKSVHNLCDSIVPTSEQIPLSSEDCIYFSKYGIKVAQKAHPSVKITFNGSATNVIFVSGPRHDVAHFKQGLDNFIHHATVPVHVSKLGMEFLKNGKGAGILQTLIKHDCISFFSKDSYSNVSLSLLCPHDTARNAESISAKITATILEKKFQFPQYFYTNVVDSPQFNNFKQKTNDKYAFSCIVENNIFKLVCQDEIQNQLSYLFQNFVTEECTIAENISMKRSEWRLLNSVMEKKWSKLESEMVENGLKVLKITSPKPFIRIRGDRNIVAQMKKKFIELLKSVHELRFTVARPGICQYFYNDPHGQVSLTGIETSAGVCMELEIQNKEGNESDLATPTGKGTSFFKKVCTANTQGVTVNLFRGDITQFNRAEVITNAANEHLHHGLGVAKAIADRGGPIISEDSHDYVSKKGKVPTGSAVLFNRVGNLPSPYQAIVHAVGPKWSSPDKDKNRALLRKTIKNTLKNAKNFSSIAIPAISSGEFGFPVNIAADSLVQGIIEFFEENSTNQSSCVLNEIYFIIFEDNVPAFKRAIKEHLHNVHMFDEAEPSCTTAKAKTTPTTSHSSLPQPQNKRMSSYTRMRSSIGMSDSLLKKYIKITNGDILQHQSDVITSITNQQFGFGGQVGRKLLEAAGSGLQDECQSVSKPIQYGDIVTTKAHKLIHSKHIVHGVLPGYNGLQSEKTLRSVIKKCLQECTRLNAKSVSIPSIGAGNLGYPSDVVAKCLLEEAFQYLSDNEGQTSLQLVHFVIFDGAVYQVFQQYYSSMSAGTNNSSGGLTEMEVSSTKPNTSTGASTLVSSDNSRKKRSLRKLPSSSSSSSDAPARPTPDTNTCCSFALSNGINLHLIQGDITAQSTDVIVNPTNPELLLTGGGVSGALLKIGGQVLQDACDRTRASNMKAAEGKVIETRCEGIGQLRCKSIFHIVFEGKEQKKLVRTILACLEQAEKMQYTSIAIPAIGTGIVSYPSAKAAEGIVTALKQFTQKKPNHVKEIRMVIFQPSMFKKFTDAFKKIKEENEGFLNYLGAQFLDKGGRIIAFLTSHNVPIASDQPNDGLDDFHNVDTPNNDQESDHIATPLDKDVLSSISVDTEVTIFIYGESEPAVKRAEKMLRSIVDTLVINEEVDDTNIPELPSAVLSDLQKFAHDHNVDIEIDNDCALHTIKLHGCQNDVLKVKDKVRDALSLLNQFKAKEEVAAAFAKHVKWVKQLSDGTEEDYSELSSYEIEQAYQKKPKSMYRHIENGVHQFSIDFSKMEETNFQYWDHPNPNVKVTRVDLAEAYGKPSNWVPMPKDSNNQEATVHLVTLKQNDREYQDTLSKFDATMKSKYNQIVSIQRIQNPVLFGQYIHRKKEMEKRNPPDCQNERWLFHGTKPANIDAINTQGLNRSLKSVTAYGQGVYFARDASYSHRYTQPDHNSHHHMYLARVLTGEYTEGNHSMKIAPPKNHQQNQHILFDSTVNKIVDPSIFVVYTDSQLYTAYLITYQ